MLTARRDRPAASRFLRKALLQNRKPEKVNIDKSGANKAALDRINKPSIFTGKIYMIIRQIKYLNNIVEQDHRHIKRITNPMMDFKKFHTAARTIAGIELVNMIKKGQLEFKKHYDQNLTPAQQFYRLATI